MPVTYYVALPFVRTEEGVAPGQAQQRVSGPCISIKRMPLLLRTRQERWPSRHPRRMLV
jgi:hypothetical protein